jgi:hypothetical protein
MSEKKTTEHKSTEKHQTSRAGGTVDAAKPSAPGGPTDDTMELVDEQFRTISGGSGWDVKKNTNA